MKISQLTWFVCLWLAGVVAMFLIAGVFRLLMQLAYH